MDARVDIYRVLTLDEKKNPEKKIDTQGMFTGLEGVKAYLTARNEKMTEKDKGVFRLEWEKGGKWIFLQNFVI